MGTAKTPEGDLIGLYAYITTKKRKKLKENLSFPGSSDSKVSACNAGDQGSIPGSGRSPGEGNGNHSSILAWKIPWTKEPGRLQSIGLQRVRLTE